MDVKSAFVKVHTPDRKHANGKMISNKGKLGHQPVQQMPKSLLVQVWPGPSSRKADQILYKGVIPNKLKHWRMTRAVASHNSKRLSSQSLPNTLHS